MSDCRLPRLPRDQEPVTHAKADDRTRISEGDSRSLHVEYLQRAISIDVYKGDLYGPLPPRKRGPNGAHLAPSGALEYMYRQVVDWCGLFGLVGVKRAGQESCEA